MSIFSEFAIWPWLHWASQLDLKVWMILHRIPWSALLKVFSLVVLLLLVVAFFLLPAMASTKTLLALDFEVEEKVLLTSISSSSRCLGGCRVSFSESSPSSRPPRLVLGAGWRTQCKWIQCQWCPVLPLSIWGFHGLKGEYTIHPLPRFSCQCNVTSSSLWLASVDF